MLSVYPSDRAVAGLVLGARRRRRPAQRFHGRGGDALAARGITVATFDFPYIDGRDEAPGQGAGARSRMADGRRWPDAHDAFARRCRSSSAASRWAAASRRTSPRRSVDGITGLVYLGYPLHPPGSPAAPRRAPARHHGADAVRAGHRDPFGTAEEIRELLPRLNRAHTLFEVAGRRSLVQGPGKGGGQETGRGADRDLRRRRVSRLIEAHARAQRPGNDARPGADRRGGPARARSGCSPASTATPRTPTR